MQFVEFKSSDDGATDAVGDESTERDNNGKQAQGHESGRSSGVPKIRGGERDHAGTFSSGHPPTKSTLPSCRTRRPDHPAWAMW